MLSPDTYNLWFAPLRACGQDTNAIVLEVANDFCEVWLKDNYMGLLQDVVALASGHQCGYPPGRLVGRPCVRRPAAGTSHLAG